MEEELENTVNGTVATFINKYEKISFAFSWIFFLLSFFWAWLYQYKDLVWFQCKCLLNKTTDMNSKYEIVGSIWLKIISTIFI